MDVNPKRELVARWREAGEWWVGEPSRDVIRYLDSKGILHEKEKLLPSVGKLKSKQLKPATEDHSEEWELRIHKTRDEKVAKACGLLKPEPILSNIQKGELQERTERAVMAPYGTSRKEIGRAMRLHALRAPKPVATAHSAQLYAPLHLYSGYAFGRGTILAEELPLLCGSVGIPAAALVDPFSLAGAVEFSRRAKSAGVKPLIGTSIQIPDGGWLVLIARSRIGYQNLSMLLSSCHLEQPRQFPMAIWGNIERFSQDLLCLTGGDLGPINRHLTHKRFKEAHSLLDKLSNIYGQSNLFVEIERSFLPWEISVNQTLLSLAQDLSLTPVAGGIVTHARREHYPAQDTLVCIDTLCAIDEIIGRKPTRHPGQPQIDVRPERSLNAERFLRTPVEMSRIFADRPDLLVNTLTVVDRCDDDILPNRSKMPSLFPDSSHALREITMAGAFERHEKLSQGLKRRIDRELDRICRLDFADHFLLIWDACRWATDQGILHSGRGSVVDSAVAYCLGLSRIDAYKHNLHFDRFLPEDGSKRPDIDVDFEAKRRDDIRLYFADKYGHDRVAGIAAIGAYCTRGIIRELGKVFGLPPEVIGFLAKRIHGGISPNQLESALERRPELAQSGIPKERFHWVFELSERLMDVPRNMRAHSSGLIVSDSPIAEMAPVMWSASPFSRQRIPTSDMNNIEEDESVLFPIIQWDKRSAKYYFDKFDILCLRGHDVISGTQDRIRVADPDFNIEKIDIEDEAIFRTMRAGELIGIPQSASPAMRQAHMRLRTENLHDASLVQAGIRPGVGGAVKINELIARRRGKPFSFEHPDLEKVLGLTYGIIVFQEQVDQLLQTFCGYTSGEAEDIREAIHKKRREDYGEQMKIELIDRVIKNGYSPVVAEKVYEYVSGFKGYGFAQGHALAFAEISLRSIHCQQNFPAEYFAALLTAQPAGYYGPNTLVNEARLRGVAILQPDINRSIETFSVEDVLSHMDPKLILPNAGIRVGLMQILGLSKPTRRKIVAERDKPFQSFFDFVLRVCPARDELENLIQSGAFDSLYPNRRSLLWAIPTALNCATPEPGCLPLAFHEPKIDRTIEDFSIAEKAVRERTILGLDVSKHLMAFERDRVATRGGITSAQAKQLKPGQKAIVVGNPIRLRFPPTPSGKRVVFFDLEDETGLLNVTCFDAVYRRDGHAIVCSPYVTIIGEGQDRDGHTAFLAHRVFAYQPKMLSQANDPEAMPIAIADFLAQ